jgi:hypothetical protein
MKNNKEFSGDLRVPCFLLPALGASSKQTKHVIEKKFCWEEIFLAV